MARGRREETINEETGEIVPSEEGFEGSRLSNGEKKGRYAAVDTVSTFLANGGLDKALANLEKVTQAKKEDFQELDADFWKPEKKGENFQGVYMGFIRGEGRKFGAHVFLRPSEKKNKPPIQVRINGTAVLNSRLQQVERGSGVYIEFQGKVQNADSEGSTATYDVKEMRPELPGVQ
jgi:hypothetical protein